MLRLPEAGNGKQAVLAKPAENGIQIVNLGPLLPIPCTPRPIAEERRGKPLLPRCKEDVKAVVATRYKTASSRGRQAASARRDVGKLASLDRIAADVERVYRQPRTRGGGRVRRATRRYRVAVRGGAWIAPAATCTGWPRIWATRWRAAERKPVHSRGRRNAWIIGRCCGEFATPLDRREAFACGRANETDVQFRQTT